MPTRTGRPSAAGWVITRRHHTTPGFRSRSRSSGAGSGPWPAISTGVYGYPKRAAAAVALAAMREHAPAFDRVVACLYDAESEAVYREVASELGVVVDAEPD